MIFDIGFIQTLNYNFFFLEVFILLNPLSNLLLFFPFLSSCHEKWLELWDLVPLDLLLLENNLCSA